MLHDHIISISYDRVLEVSAQLGDAAFPKYVEDGVVCPPDLRRGLFTTTSTTIQLLQHQPLLSMEPAFLCSSTQPQIIKARSVNHFNLETRKQKTVLELPDSYTNIHPERRILPLPELKGWSCLVLICWSHSWHWNMSGLRKSASPRIQRCNTKHHAPWADWAQPKTIHGRSEQAH